MPCWRFALSFVLLTFGSAIGLSVVSFEPRGRGVAVLARGGQRACGSSGWLFTSFGAGGYLAGRLRRPAPGASVDEIDVRDGAHGLLGLGHGALVGAVLRRQRSGRHGRRSRLRPRAA